MSDPFLGEIKIFAGNFAPRNYAFCNGQPVAINQNQSLYALLGTTYGGDGRTNFNLPDMRGRMAVGKGQGPGLTDRRLGSIGGTETVTLTAQELPSHQHGLSQVSVTANNPTANINVTAKLRANSNTDGDVNNPGTNSVLGATPNEAIYVDQDPDTDMRSNSINTTASISNFNVPLSMGGNTDPAGGGQSHYNIHPWLAVNYIIAMAGVFPSRS